MIFSLPLIMVTVFLIFTLVVGLYYSKKTTTLKEYAIGHKNFTTATLVATVLATMCGGGGLIRTVQKVYDLGLYWVMVSFFYPVTLWMLSPLSMRMSSFMNNISMAETIGQVYGKLPRIITALSSISCSIAVLAIQVNVIAQAISMCMNDSSPTILSIIATLILIVYSTFGGIRAVTITDVLQCITFVLILPCLAWLMFHKINKPFADILTVLSSYEKFQFRHIFQWNRQFIAMISIALTCIMTDPDIFQRIYMSSNVIQAKKVFFLSGIFNLCITSVILLIGIFVFIANPKLAITAIWPTITIDLSPLFKSFLAISLLAMAMSTADSALNTCAVMASHDIIGSLRTKQLSNTNQLYIARITAFIVGILALLLAIYQQDLLALLMLASDFFIPIVSAPLFLAIFGFRSSSRTALIGMVTGTIVILIWNKYIPDIEGSVPAMLANGIAMLVAHYILSRQAYKSWENPDLEFKQLKQSRKRRFYRFKQHIKSLFSASHRVSVHSYQWVLLAFYVIISSWVPFFNRNAINIGEGLENQYLLYWPFIQCLMALAMIMYIILSKKEPTTCNRYIWLSVLIFCLPMDALWHMTYVQDKRMALALFFCHFGILFLLLPVCVALFILGLVVFVMVFSLHNMIAMFMANLEVFFPATLLLVSLIYVQQKYMKKVKQAQLFSDQQQANIEQEIQRTNMVRYLDMVTTEQFSQADVLAKISTEQTQFLSDIAPEQLRHSHITDTMDKFINFAAFFDERAKLAQSYFHLKPKPISLYALVNHLETTLETTLNYLPRLFIEPSLKLSTTLTCDITLITQALEAIVLNLLDPNYTKRPIQQQIISIAFFTTHIKLSESNLHNPQLTHLQWSYPAIAIRLYNATTYPYKVPTIQESYDETIQNIACFNSAKQIDSVKEIDLSKKRIKSIIAAHNGYYLDSFTLEQENLAHSCHTSLWPKLVILPQNSLALQKDIIVHMPHAKRSAKDVKIMGDALIAMIEFQHFMVKVVKLNQSILSNILYLLKKAYGIRKHDNGQLLLLRAMGIVQEVATFTPDHMVMYATLLYGLPYYSLVPISYIRANYDMVIASYVRDLLSIKSFKKQQKYQQAIAQNKLDMVCVKLIERWYDLENAKGYRDQQYVKTLVQETLAVDVPVAKRFFSNVIGKNLAYQLENAALCALKLT